MWAHNKKEKGSSRKQDQRGGGGGGWVVGHRRYASLARSLDISYSLENIGFGKRATQKAHRGTLGQSPEERRSLKQQTLEGKLAPLEWI